MNWGRSLGLLGVLWASLGPSLGASLGFSVSRPLSASLWASLGLSGPLCACRRLCGPSWLSLPPPSLPLPSPLSHLPPPLSRLPGVKEVTTRYGPGPTCLDLWKGEGARETMTRHRPGSQTPGSLDGRGC